MVSSSHRDSQRKLPSVPTVHVVDDDSSVRCAMRRLLRSAGYLVKASESAQSYLDEASPDTPGCVVLDLRMPGMDGLMLQERMAELGLTAPIVFVTAHGDVSASVRAMKQGAVDFLEKPFESQDLLAAVERALERDLKLRERIDATNWTQAGLQRLTPREYEVLTYVIGGTLNKLIARSLGVSEKTIKVHRGRVMKKMGAGSLADLVRGADRFGIEPVNPQDARGVV